MQLPRTIFINHCARCGKGFTLGEPCGVANGRPVCSECEAMMVLAGTYCLTCGEEVHPEGDEITFLVAPRKEDFVDWGGGGEVTAFEVPMMVCPKCHNVFQTAAQHDRLRRVRNVRDVEAVYKLE